MRIYVTQVRSLKKNPFIAASFRPFLRHLSSILQTQPDTRDRPTPVKECLSAFVGWTHIFKADSEKSSKHLRIRPVLGFRLIKVPGDIRKWFVEDGFSR